MKQSIQHIISESISVKSSILKNETLLKTIDSIVNVITNSFQAGFKVQFCGNGGSAATSSHFSNDARHLLQPDGFFSASLSKIK